MHFMGRMGLDREVPEFAMAYEGCHRLPRSTTRADRKHLVAPCLCWDSPISYTFCVRAVYLT